LEASKGNVAQLDIVTTLEEFALGKLVAQRYFNMTELPSARTERFSGLAKAPKTIPDDLKAFIMSRNLLDKVGVSEMHTRVLRHFQSWFTCRRYTTMVLR
jgi:hypothetical protein